MSEDKFHCVELDDAPELWDQYCPQAIKDKIEAIKLTHDRIGKCNRCGSCCYWIRMVDDKKVLMPCKYLIFVDEVPTCSIRDTEIYPDACRYFPQKIDTTNKHPNCGFSWVEKTV